MPKHPNVGYTRFLGFLSDLGPHFPTRQPRTLHRPVDSDANSARSTLPWVRTALAGRSPSESPCAAFMKMSEHASELTPGLERLVAASFMSLLAPWQMACLLDREDAKNVLETVISKVTTRAEKRKHEAAIKRSAELEAAAVEEQAKRAHGAARAAKRARIASRPVKDVFARDNCGRRV